MSLSPIKIKILEDLLLNDKPAKATQIAKESGNDFRPTMMHLLDLTRKGYASSPEKGQFIITDKGKNALGINGTSSENAKIILANVPSERAFHFYTALQKPTSTYANNLQDFMEKIQKINAESIDFHVQRGDFERWFAFIKDEELAKKMALLKKWNLHGEELRQKLYAIVENRYKALSAMN
jgi:predicted transcriptional regulator